MYTKLVYHLEMPTHFGEQNIVFALLQLLPKAVITYCRLSTALNQSAGRQEARKPGSRRGLAHLLHVTSCVCTEEAVERSLSKEPTEGKVAMSVDSAFSLRVPVALGGASCVIDFPLALYNPKRCARTHKRVRQTHNLQSEHHCFYIKLTINVA